MACSRYRREGRFFGRRVNCERVPLLPAWVVGRLFDDPRNIPYLLVWTDPEDGSPRDTIRISAKIDPPVLFPPDWTDVFEIKRPIQGRNFIRTILRRLPRNGGEARLLGCPYCDRWCRGLYGWEPGGQYIHSVEMCSWRCRRCAKLRYASEGGGLIHRHRGASGQQFDAAFGCRTDRPEPWLPFVFTSPQEAVKGGLCSLI